MVKAGETLFLAGPPDTFSEDDTYAAFQGRLGGSLLVLSTKGGEKLAEYKLDDPPVFDGMAASKGRLYISTQGGTLLCFGGEEDGQEENLSRTR